MQAWMKTTVLETYAGMLGDPNYNTVVRNKLKLRGASAGLSMKMEQFFQWTIVRPGVGNMKAKYLLQIMPT